MTWQVSLVGIRSQYFTWLEESHRVFPVGQRQRSMLPAQAAPVWSLARLPRGSAGKEPTCNAGDLGSIPGLGRAPGEGKGYPLQYSDLENSMDCIVHGVTKSQARLSDFHFQGTRVHMLQLRVCMLQLKIPHATQQRPKILCAATKTQHRQINKSFLFLFFINSF